MGYRSEATVTLDFTAMKPGERAGMECIGKQFHGAGIMIGGTDSAPLPMVYAECDSSVVFQQPISEIGGERRPSRIFLRLTADTEANYFRFSYSLDGTSFHPLGESFAMQSGFWKGIRPGLYAYSAISTENSIASPTKNGSYSGRARFTDFIYLHDGPETR